MAEPGGRAVVERFVRALEDKDSETQEALLADDFIDEMPQSGERVRGSANAIAIALNGAQNEALGSPRWPRRSLPLRA